MCRITEIKKENHNYYMPIIKRHYMGADKVKLARTKFEKEIKCALTYGALNAVQTILDAHKADPYKSVDEISGDLQMILVDTHKTIKRELGLKIPDFTLDHAIAKYGSI